MTLPVFWLRSNKSSSRIHVPFIIPSYRHETASKHHVTLYSRTLHLPFIFPLSFPIILSHPGFPPSPDGSPIPLFGKRAENPLSFPPSFSERGFIEFRQKSTDSLVTCLCFSVSSLFPFVSL